MSTRTFVAVATLAASSSSGAVGLPCDNDALIIAQQVQAAHSDPVPLAVGDIDGDGYDDAARIVGQVLRVLFSNGDGTFIDRPNAINLGLGVPDDVWLKDMNNDGLIDVVAFGSLTTMEGSPNALSVRLSEGGGFFGPPVVISDEFISAIVGLADMDDDGQTEIAVAHDAKVRLFRRSEAGVYTQVDEVDLDDVGADIGAFRVGDIDNDGDEDLLAFQRSDFSASNTAIRVFLGGGGLELPEPLSTGISVSINTGIELGDSNGDGLLDLVAAGGNSTFSAMRFYHGDGAGAFTSASYSVPDTFLRRGGLKLANLNNDARVDIVIPDQRTLLLSIGDRFFQRVSLSPKLGAREIAIGDFDGNSYDDFAGTQFNPETPAHELFTVTVSCPYQPDFDHNGVTDMVDLAIMLASWGSAETDLNGDGTTNSVDIALLLASWGECE